MKLLITGGAGFMGSNFIHYILRRYPEYQIVNLDKLTYAGNLANLHDVAHDLRYRFIKGDIANPADVEKAIQGVDAVVNYAAETHVDRSILDARDFAVTDVLGTLALLQAVHKYNISRFVQISTDEVFGSITNGEFSGTSPFDPSSPYSASKAGGDHMCMAFYKTYGTPVILTHSCNFYGPNQYPEKVIPLFITNLLENKRVPLYGEGINEREWIFTEDHCAAIDTILHKGEVGNVYNIGTGHRIKNIDLTKKILTLMGKADDMIERVKDRPGHDLRYAVSCEPLKKLGWQAKVPFDTGLEQTIAWYRAQTAWWKPIKSGDYLAYYKKQYEDR